MPEQERRIMFFDCKRDWLTWARWAAQDSDGELCVYEARPVVSTFKPGMFTDPGFSKWLRIGRIDPPLEDWQNTVVELNLPKGTT